jgi:hypothetical protein
MFDRVNLDAEGAFERGHLADCADHEPVREPVGHPEPARLEMRDDRGFVGLRGRMEGVELGLRQEAMVCRRCGILDLGEERLEAVAIAEREPDDDVMSIRRARPAAIRRRREERREGPGLRNVRGAGERGAPEPESRDDGGRHSPPERPHP